MNTISPNTLFHFTNSPKNLISILKNEFYPGYSLEKYTLGEMPVEVAFPMVCFCDIPLSQIKNHIKIYGYYGIGMSKKWAVKNSLNPVLYIEESSNISKNIKEIGDNLLVKLPDKLKKVGQKKLAQAAGDAFWDVFMCIKAYEGDLYRGTKKFKNVKFYDEREWRYIPTAEKCDSKRFLTKDEFQNPAKKDQENAKVKKAKLSFGPKDIKYIIVKKEEEILPMLKKLEEIKGAKYSFEKLKILTTRIITSKQIEEDF